MRLRGRTCRSFREFRKVFCLRKEIRSRAICNEFDVEGASSPKWIEIPLNQIQNDMNAIECHDWAFLIDRKPKEEKRIVFVSCHHRWYRDGENKSSSNVQLYCAARKVHHHLLWQTKQSNELTVYNLHLKWSRMYRDRTLICTAKLTVDDLVVRSHTLHFCITIWHTDTHRAFHTHLFRVSWSKRSHYLFYVKCFSQQQLWRRGGKVRPICESLIYI